jgi:hypothetical protein
VFEITFECNSLGTTFEASSYVRCVLYVGGLISFASTVIVLFTLGISA